MCWCITHSHTALDVDVLFRSASTTGQNIKLAESIVHCVRAMGCPVSIQAHQIHGQDWANVHPVIAWLLKHMFEARAARFARLRAFSEQQFSKNFEALGGAEEELASDGGRAAIPERKCRFAGDRAAIATEEAAVFACLLEFGERVDGSKVAGGGGAAATKLKAVDGAGGTTSIAALRKTLGGGLLDRALEAADASEAEARLQDLAAAEAMKLGAMVEGGGGALTVAGSTLGKMVRLQASEIAAVKERYEAERDLHKGAGDGKLSGGGDDALYREAAAHASSLEAKVAKARAAVDAKRAANANGAANDARWT